MAHITQTQSVSIGDNNSRCGNIVSSFNTYKSDEDAQIMRWLSPLEPNIRHQDVRAGRFGSVGGWLLETSEFREWRDGEGGADSAVVFCSGNPGVGKTYLSSLVIDSLCDQANERDIAVACLYYDFLAQQGQTITDMVGAILKQLIGRCGIPKYLRDAFLKGKKEIGGRGLLLTDMMRMLKTAIASIPQVFICIDALDECLPKSLPEFLESLRGIVRESPGARVFLTGRPHVREDLERYFPKAVVIPISPSTNDVRDYVEMRLNRDTEPEAMNDGLRADIVKMILERISDIFLLISLHIDAILGEVTIRQRRKKLEEMTRGNGLSDAYTATLSRLKAQKGNKSILGLKVLMWVSHAERPLRAEELCHALGVEMGTSDLDLENVPALRTLLASCLGLVTVEGSSSTVRLMHFTLREHLLRDPTLLPSPHSTIAEVCLTYLSFESVRGLSPILDSPPSTMSLLNYASCFWGKHLRMEMTGNARILALKFLDRFDEHISARLLLLSRNEDGSPGPYFFRTWRRPTGFTGLHGIAFFGIVELVAAAFEVNEWNVNASDRMGSTALTWAAARGHEEVVRILLERGDVNPNQADVYDRTPLWWAVQCGHERVVEMLLEWGDLSPNKANPYHGKTPLVLAAEYGNERVVKMLLKRSDVSAGQVDIQYRVAPLLCGVMRGAPLSYSVVCGREGVRTPRGWGGLNPYHPVTKNRQITISAGTGYGYQRAVKVPPGPGYYNPNQANPSNGKTLLMLAAEHGHERVVKMLLERKDVNPNKADTRYGQTPLSWAAGHGHEGVTKILLERRDVNPNHADTKYGRSPLWWAAEHGHAGVVKMLLERSDVNPNQADTRYGQTPFSCAAEHGHEGVVKILLERGDVDPNQTETEYGQTPLSCAAEHGHEGVAKLLLERKDVPTATPDTQGQTPLSLALSKGHDGVVRILEERDRPTPDRTLQGSHASLPPSTRHGNECVAGNQPRSDDPNINITDLDGQPTLRSANPDEREGVLDLEDSILKPADGGLPSTVPPKLPQSPSMLPLKFLHPPKESDTHFNITRSTLSFGVDRHFIITSFICLLSLLVFILSPSLPYVL